MSRLTGFGLHTIGGAGMGLPSKGIRPVGGNKGGEQGGTGPAKGPASMDKIGGKGVGDAGRGPAIMPKHTYGSDLRTSPVNVAKLSRDQKTQS